MAESDELIGAEAHVLSKCRSRKVAEKFLTVIQQFKNRMEIIVLSNYFILFCGWLEIM